MLSNYGMYIRINIASKMQQTFMVLFILNVAIFQGCKDKNCTKIYTPILKMEVLKGDDTIHLLDTLVLRGRMASSLEDKETGIVTNFNNFRFDLFAGVFIYSDTSQLLALPTEAITKFDIIDIKGSRNNTNNGFFINYLAANDSINFEYKFIPKDTGLFLINVFHIAKNSAHGRNNVRITNTNCKEYIDYTAVIFNEGKTNRNLVSLYDTSYFDKRQIWALNHSNFFFYVKP